MGKNNRRKRSRPPPSTNTGSWKSVSVNISSRGEAVGDNGDHQHQEETEIDVENTDKYSANHYDDPKLSRKAHLDLEMDPGEDCGMFYGLEVLDASQYRVEQSGSFKRFVIKGSDDATTSTETKPKSTETDKSSSSSSKDADADEDDFKKKASETDASAEPNKKKRKKKKKDKSKKTGADEGNVATEETPSKSSLEQQDQPKVTPEQLSRIQTSWSRSTGGAHLHDTLLESLHRLGFDSPTPIQAATLSASTMGRRNLVGAAPTGSGKTLAFLLPILNNMLQNTTEAEVGSDANEDNCDVSSAAPKKLQALIMTPTRELATQIYAECEKLVPNQCVTLVGGIALVKQKRLLSTKRPPVVVATPGRLWAMLSSADNEHLRDLSQIQFLVLDEADRMTQKHSFPQLVKILDLVNDANPSEEDESDDEESDDEGEDGSRLLGLPGIRGEAQLTMLTDDILNQVRAQKSSTTPERMDTPEDDFSEEDSDGEIDGVEGDIPEDLFATPESRVHRQTFIYSATLTLPFTSTRTSSSSSSKRNKRGKAHGLDGGIAEILEKTNAMGETKVVDLSSSSPSTSSLANHIKSNGVRLPPGLSLEQIKCTQMHKDSYLYAYLMTTAQGSSGPCLVFCNSIAAVRRVGATFQTLGFNARILHAHMQQRARFKAIESLKNPEKRVIVVCTDVAARGLDIPSVSTVVHYDVARAVDTFVHRSGRTARGMGAGAVGSSLSLIAPAEDKAHIKIMESLSVPFHKVLLDGRLLTSSQERVSLASKIYTAGEMEQKTNSHNRWFQEMAKVADLDLDDDMMEDENNRSEKERLSLLEAKRARGQLARLLKEPMRTQKFGKFLSTNSAALQNQLKQPLSK